MFGARSSRHIKHNLLWNFAKRVLVTAAFAVLGLTSLTASAAAADKLTIQDSFELPDWFQLKAEVRGRVQHLDNQFRPALPETDTIFALRSLVDMRFRVSKDLFFGFELQDSRLVGADEATAVSTGIINTFNLLQAYVRYSTDDVMGIEGRHQISAGRMTMQLGRGRLIGRQGFRNAVGAFTGVHYEWDTDDTSLDAFWLLPIDRLPNDRAALLENDSQFDRESLAQQLWAIHLERRDLPFGLLGQVYLFGIHERDQPDRNTRNRQLYTPGFTVFKPAAPGEWFVDLEMSFNIGRSRVTSSVLETEDLDHFAYTAHAEVGYRFTAPWSPLLILQFDFASGDADPTDGKNGQYDTLFGPKRGDFGDTDIYGALARENIIAPAVAVRLFPTDTIAARVRYQPAWLEEARDGWPDIGVRDITGQSGRFIGHQIETRFTWDVANGNIRLGAGADVLFKGRFARAAPNANPATGDTLYLYSDVTLRF